MKIIATILIAFLSLIQSFECHAEVEVSPFNGDYGWFVSDQPAPDSDQMKSKDGFGVQILIVTGDKKGAEIQNIQPTQTVMRNEEVFIIFPFINPGVDDSSTANVIADLVITSPNGDVYGSSEGFEICQKLYDTPKDKTQQGETHFGLTIEDEEQLGTYKIEAKIYDKIKNITLKLQAELTVKERECPSGYTWFKIPEMGVTMLKPDGWHTFKPETPKGIIAFQMSKGDSADAAHTALNLRVNKRVDEHFPMYYGTEFLFGFSARGESWVHGQPIKEDKDGWTRGGLTVEKEMTIGGLTQKYTIHYSLISNPETHTLYTFSFRTPSKDWEKNKKVWTTIGSPDLNEKL